MDRGIELAFSPARNHFDPKFKIIISRKMSERDPEIMDWLDKNTTGLVSIKQLAWCEPFVVGEPVVKMYVGFENTADALIFKIRYQ